MAQQLGFTEKELMNDLLMSEKQVSSAYTVGITESSCANLRSVLALCEQNVLKNQEEFFNVMSKRGWYQIKKAPSQDIQRVKDKYNQIKSELS
ncbi:Coat F domain-containing protein [Geosporobacter subterraneus DSM 17957]|uniref:Coat F domain-containing protein n=1 Tax=Geosporobacter subterraneus DSM 17957 TaxID=1121919 RepID=A0A1M6LY04_9FIRM|nr:spore coat protein [Geosporobacter subterraneus]SHJ76040.1 Coat F domain-containing protein [Geosporobacter subterraneus DSM 17957]